MSYEIPVYEIHLVRDSVVKVPSKVIDSPDMVAQVVREYLGPVDREHLVVLMVDIQNQLIGINTVSIGSVDHTVAHPREIFKPAILSNAVGIILAHNHPSGDVKPSSEDKKLFKILHECGELLQIKFLDSVILGDGNQEVFSMRRSAYEF